MSPKSKATSIFGVVAVVIVGVPIWMVYNIGVRPDIKCDPWSLKRGESAATVMAKCGETEVSRDDGVPKVKARYPTMGDTASSPYRESRDATETWHYGNIWAYHVNLYFKGGVLDDVQIIDK